MQDFDSPWKNLLDRYFADCLKFFFPDVHAVIDWSKEWSSLEQELRKLLPDSKQSSATVDKLVQVYLLGGDVVELFVHLEIQNQQQKKFPERMLRYFFRIYDRHDQMPISLAILGDETPNWHPTTFEYNRLGCSLTFSYRTAKLLDYLPRTAELENHSNPFATVVLGHLATLATRNDPQSRLAEKLRLIRRLYDRGMSREDIQELFRFIDWVLQLPDDLEQQFHDDLFQLEQEKNMQYVTSVERLALAKGELAGAKALLVQIIKRRFPNHADALAPTLALLTLDEVRALADELLDNIETTDPTRLLARFEHRSQA